MKPWELENLDFEIPWLYILEPIDKKWCKSWNCEILYNILENNLEWKDNITKFFGTYIIHVTLSDFYYLPNFYTSKFCEITKIMYHFKLFLECAVPTSLVILSASKYQIIYYEGLWGKNRANALFNLYHHYKEITIHPIKFSKMCLQKLVNKYIYFINAIDF